MITQLPIAKVMDCNRVESLLCANPLMQARKLCQESDAKKAPKSKSKRLIVEWTRVARNPRISDVKYVTVTGFNNVRPRIIP
jgi:hypothetical protein